MAADKRRHGGFYDDSRGIRYLPPELHLKLQDYTGAIKYFNWFNKNFPEDACFAAFLFEWAVALFKTKRIKEAENKVLETFFSSKFLLDIYLEITPIKLESDENQNREQHQIRQYFQYKRNQEDLVDFSGWLETFVTSEKYKIFTDKLIELERQLEIESGRITRTKLVNKQYCLLEGIRNV